MKIVVLESSPHKKGSSNMLAGELVRGAEEAGHSVQVLDVARMSVHPCLGCDHCGMGGPCAQKDDVPIIRDALLSADMAVFVTPVYYFGMSAQLKLVIDRFYSYTTKLSGKHLKTALVAAAWDSNADVMPCLEMHYKKLCRYMNFQDQGMILGLGCGTPAMTKGSAHTLYIYSSDLRTLLATHNVTWSHRDSFCEGQYEALPQPEEFPSVPARTAIRQLKAPDLDISFEKFNFDKEGQDD